VFTDVRGMLMRCEEKSKKEEETEVKGTYKRGV